MPSIFDGYAKRWTIGHESLDPDDEEGLIKQQRRRRRKRMVASAGRLQKSFEE